MQPFALERPRDLAAALAFRAQAGRNDAPAEYIAGGTDMVQLLQEDVRRPERLVSLAGLLDNRIEVGSQGLRLGAAATMAEVAAHPAVVEQFPVISEALLNSASPQVRNQATMGGNLLQRTRCPYYPRCRLRCLQQARAGLRLLRHRRRKPLACRARHQRQLHRHQPVRPCGGARRPGCGRSRCAVRAGSAPCRLSTFIGCPATRPTSRRCSNPARSSRPSRCRRALWHGARITSRCATAPHSSSQSSRPR